MGIHMIVITSADTLAAFTAEDEAILSAPIDTGATAEVNSVACPVKGCRHTSGAFIDPEEGRAAIRFHIFARSANHEPHRVYMDNKL
jgi:hypothetical protein